MTIKINWKVLPDYSTSYGEDLSDRAKKEIKKIEKYLAIPDLETTGYQSDYYRGVFYRGVFYRNVFFLTHRLFYTAAHFDTVVGYLLTRLGVPVFKPQESAHVQIGDEHFPTAQKQINALLDLIDLLGVRKTVAILNIKPQKDASKDKLGSST